MTTDEARAILIRYRPGSNPNDPEIARALQLAGNDAELNAWLATQNAFQNSVHAELSQIPVPADLKSRILAGRPRAVVFWRRREFLALAASIMIVLAGLSWFLRSSEKQTFANFQSRMISFALRTYAMDILTPDGNKVRAYLANQGAPADYSLTPGLEQIPVKGGGRLSWQNHPVAMICFALPKDETLYLFVLNRASVPDRDISGEPALVAGNHLSTATWSEGGKIYMLAARTDIQTLAKLAAQGGPGRESGRQVPPNPKGSI